MATSSEAAPAPADAAPADRTDRRFRVRWGERGLCGPEDAGRIARRPALLETFLALDAARATVRHDPRVDPEVLMRVQATVIALQSPSPGPIRRLLGVELDRLSPPVVHVYADAQQLRDVSCVNRAAIGYYDGAIHLSGDVRHGPELVRQTVVHEYVHHVLLGLGIEVPTWLHEGLAMELAGETWWVDPSLGLVAWLREKHLPFEAMTGAFPHAADETFALAAYYQSLSMLEFLRELRGDDRIAELVQALASGAVAPEDAFTWAAGTSGEALEQAWKEFLARRLRDRDATMQQLNETAARMRR